MRLFCPRESTEKDMLSHKLSLLHGLKTDIEWCFYFRIIFDMIFKYDKYRRVIIICNSTYGLYESHILNYLDFCIPMNNVWYQFLCINTYNTLWLEQGKLLSMSKNKPSHTHIYFQTKTSLKWRHNGGDKGVSNHQSNHCLLNRLFRRRSKKTSKLRVTSLCAGHLTVTGEFPAQMASNEENVSIWWRHHVVLWDIAVDLKDCFFVISILWHEKAFYINGVSCEGIHW